MAAVVAEDVARLRRIADGEHRNARFDFPRLRFGMGARCGGHGEAGAEQRGEMDFHQMKRG
jgi:hypothetical protein